MNKKEQIKHILETEDNVDIITNKICKLYDKTIETKTKYEHGDKVICIKPFILNPSPRHYCKVKEGSIHDLICTNNTVGGTLGIFGIMCCTNPKFEEHFKLYTKPKEEYDILSFKQDSGMTDLWTYFDNQGWARNNNGRMETKPYRTLDDIINNHLNGGVKYNIYSVKRLSDNTIFTLGDTIQLVLGNENTIQTIDSIKIVKNKIEFNNYGNSLSSWIKAKPVLFTTEDGVNIYDENQKLFEVILHNFHLNKDIPARACNNILDKRQDGYNSLVFYTLKAAEDYVTINKPCLSLMDLRKAGYVTASVALKQLVKSKL
jgi:hypothetical protein